MGQENQGGEGIPLCIAQGVQVRNIKYQLSPAIHSYSHIFATEYPTHFWFSPMDS